MNTFTINSYSPGHLHLDNLPLPASPGPRQVKLELLGTSINPVDRLIAQGYGTPLFNSRRHFPVILGRDAVARVVAVGKGVNDLAPGQRVIVAASPRTGGTYASVFNLPRRCLAPIDDQLPNSVAAGIGYAGLTAMQTLAAAGLTAENAAGKRVCINGASGGVGIIALMLASRWGAQVTAVASRKNHAWLQTLASCHQLVDYRDQAAMDGIEADIILNCATPAEERTSTDDPLLHILRASSASYRAYATTITPVLTHVTDHGVVVGLASSAATFLTKSLKLSREGIRYRWVMFKEDPVQLAFLARFFSESEISGLITAQLPLAALPTRFNDATLNNSPGKIVFLTDGSDLY
jgi:NADPH:quinone reductase-like Zn-dependent oxidoreductase